MKRKISFLLYLTIVTSIYSCAPKELFRNSTSQDYNLTQEELRFVQYYITSDIFLNFIETKRETGVTSENKLKSEKSIFEKEIIINKDTEGAAMFVNPNKLTIAFEKDMFLDFAPSDNEINTPYSFKDLMVFPLIKVEQLLHIEIKNII